MSELRTISHWMDGKPFAGTSTRVGPVFDPATGVQQAEVRLASAADVDAVVASAAAAAATWRASSLATRQRVLFAVREILAAKRSELAATVTSEHGKVLSDAEGEVQRGLEVVEFACGIPHLL
jgi:malonate-semialdehyde dehydrogenase (acetylating)/methylmalonate-semialdehyde dehydrogenase